MILNLLVRVDSAHSEKDRLMTFMESFAPIIDHCLYYERWLKA